MNINKSIYEEKTIDCVQTIKGRAFNYEKLKVRLPNGHVSQRDIIRHSGASAVLAIDKGNDIYLVRQYRKALEMETLEIPAGKIDAGEKPEECAVRELEEEIGMKAQNGLTFMTRIASAVGFSDEIIYIYLADDIDVSKQNLDDDEFLNVERYQLDEVVALINNGTIIDAKTIIAIQKLILKDQRPQS